MCFDNEHRHLFSRIRKKVDKGPGPSLPDTGILPLNPVQINPIDAIQGNPALSIAESIALLARLEELRNTPLPPLPERVPDYVREAQEQQRPLPERDRPQWDRYRDEPRIDRDLDRWDFRGRYGY